MKNILEIYSHHEDNQQRDWHIAGLRKYSSCNAWWGQDFVFSFYI
jgi:hypothetical protein